MYELEDRKSNCFCLNYLLKDFIELIIMKLIPAGAL